MTTIWGSVGISKSGGYRIICMQCHFMIKMKGEVIGDEMLFTCQNCNTTNKIKTIDLNGLKQAFIYEGGFLDDGNTFYYDESGTQYYFERDKMKYYDRFGNPTR